MQSYLFKIKFDNEQHVQVPNFEALTSTNGSTIIKQLSEYIGVAGGSDAPILPSSNVPHSILQPEKSAQRATVTSVPMLLPMDDAGIQLTLDTHASTVMYTNNPDNLLNLHSGCTTLRTANHQPMRWPTLMKW